MRGLVVGRFQPLHKGHAAVIKRAIEDCVHVVVAVGSSSAKQSAKDPFTFEERKQMLDAAFGSTIEVIAVPDIHDPPRWVEHVLNLTGNVDRVFGNDDRTLDLFEDDGIQVRRTGLQHRGEWEGNTIRMQMAEGDGTWRKAVPDPVRDLLDTWDAGLRLRRLESTL